MIQISIKGSKAYLRNMIGQPWVILESVPSREDSLSECFVSKFSVEKGENIKMLRSYDIIHHKQNISNLQVAAEDPNVHLVPSEAPFLLNVFHFE